MRRVLIDTDILSEYLKGKNAEVARKGEVYAQIHKRFTFTSVTVYEIVRGLEEKGAPAQVAKALSWLARNEEVVPISADYLTAARVKATAKLRGYIVELPDCLIAAVAARLALPLVTGNQRDFEAIAKTGLALEIEDWRRP